MTNCTKTLPSLLVLDFCLRVEVVVVVVVVVVVDDSVVLLMVCCSSPAHEDADAALRSGRAQVRKLQFLVSNFYKFIMVAKFLAPNENS